MIKLCQANENITNEFDKLGTVKIENILKPKVDILTKLINHML